MVFLKPWRTLSDLKSPEETFQNTFEAFRTTASNQIIDIIGNLQYYHECARAAEEGPHQELNEFNLGSEEAVEVDEIDEKDEIEEFDISEDDIELAKEGRWPIRDALFGTAGMSIAKDIGVFPPSLCVPATEGHIKKATNHDLVRFQILEDSIKQTIRKTERKSRRLRLTQDISEIANYHGSNSIDAIFPNTSFTPFVNQVPKILHEDFSFANELNHDQRIAFDIIANHLYQYRQGFKPEQLLMTVMGQAGTGKSKVIGAIDELFDEWDLSLLLAKTATTGVAATLIDGETIHSFAALPRRIPRNENWLGSTNSQTRNKRNQNFEDVAYLIIDEYSMLTVELLEMLSQVTQYQQATKTGCDATLPFGGLNIILFGDLHQFPPVGKKSSALYTQNPDTIIGELGRNVYLQFKTVIELKEQMRITDPIWSALLERSREGKCEEHDMLELRRLLVSNSQDSLPNFCSSPWNKSILVTSRHAVRVRWNGAALMKHCMEENVRLLVCPAEDKIGAAGLPPTMQERLLISRAKTKQTEKLESDVEIAIGMQAMITINIATKGDLANGTRGTISDVVLDPREPDLNVDEESQKTILKYPPAMILFKPDKTCTTVFEGIEKGTMPLFPMEKTFVLTKENGFRVKVRRRQYTITPAYAFTDYKSQGQTIEYVIVDLAKPPTGELTPFSAYVALSRSRGRNNIKLLRDFETKLFTTHPSEDLRLEDERLKELDTLTRRWGEDKENV